jgi:hypothetical protein
MREIRTYGSEGGGASRLSLPYRHSHAERGNEIQNLRPFQFMADSTALSLS